MSTKKKGCDLNSSPDADSLPKDEPIYRYDGGDSNLAPGRTLFYMLNPFVRNNFYYQIEIPTKEFMEYAARIDGEKIPYTVSDRHTRYLPRIELPTA